jgi:hypothetical protein
MKILIFYVLFNLAFFGHINGYQQWDKEAEAEMIVSNLIDLYKKTDLNQLKKQESPNPIIDKQPIEQLTEEDAKAEEIVNNLIEQYKNNDMSQFQKEKRPEKHQQSGRARNHFLHRMFGLFSRIK